MSLDLIKKQKEKIQTEKRRVTESGHFQHPLAYQPIPKGRKEATKEQVSNNQKGTMDLLNCYRKVNNHKKCKEKLTIAPDKYAAGSVSSHIQPSVSGKKGNHVSDVFLPSGSHLHKKQNFNKGLGRLNQKDFRSGQSYPGYRGTAELKVQVVKKPGEPGYQLRDRLGDLDSDLPQYDKQDIYNISNQSSPPGADPPLAEVVSDQLGTGNEEDNISKEQPNNKSNFLPKDFDPYGTTVKLSFVKELEPIQVVVEEEPTIVELVEDEEEEENNSSEQSAIRQPSLANHDGVSRMTHSGSLKQQLGGTPIAPIITEEEEEPISVMADYEPVADYELPFEANQKIKSEVLYPPQGKLKRKLNKLYEKIRSVKPNLFKSEKLINFEFRSGQQIKPVSNEDQLNIRGPETGSNWISQLLPREKRLNPQFPLPSFKKRLPVLRTEGAKRSAAILTVGIIFALTIPIGAYVQKIIEAKNRIEIKSEQAFQEAQSAKSDILSAKPEEAQHNFETAYQNFLSASDTLNQVDGVLLGVIKVLPGGGKIKSAENILEAGKHLTAAGQIMSEAFDMFLNDQGALKKKLISTDNLSSLKEATAYTPPERQDKAQTLTEAIIVFQDKLEKAKEELAAASDFFEKVNLSDVPEDKREEFLKLKGQIPQAVSGIDNFSSYSNVIMTVLGHNQAKQYLFLFENNDEMRATGGFIGTYGIIKIEEGNISQLSIDGIYNPDGQLKERVIPPKPIQKMSATWSMHDANWWPDFPKSAEKVAWFYEKTGGPSVDGVIAFTPKIMEDLLNITGPINHEKYGVTVTADNFVELSQYKVEKDYDKQLNRPKQFLADLAPLVLEKIFNAPPEKWVQIFAALSDNLAKRNMQMYCFDYNIQKTISDLGWSGEIIATPKDYLSVINTNISGQKTDKMIEQKIDHQAEIKPDGSIVDNVTITRTHHGGKEKFDWYNAVNSDWLRVYVPKGSELLHAEGYTREVDSPPVDYEKLGFIEDEMVVTEESGTNTDAYTGTRVYEDSGKTVFANWTYVSPGETLTIKYSYLLPFKLTFDDLKKPADTYSLLMQKQAGDENTAATSTVTGLENYDTIYHYPDNLPLPDWKIEEKFDRDIFAGAVLTQKGVNTN